MRASRAAGCLSDQKRRARARIVVAAPRLALAVHDGVAQNPGSVDSVAAGVVVPNAAVLDFAGHVDGIVHVADLTRLVVLHVGLHAAGIVPSADLTRLVAMRVGLHAVCIVPCADLTRLVAMRVGLRAARAVRRAAVWFAAAHFGVHSGASVELAVAAPAVAVALRAELPVPLVA